MNPVVVEALKAALADLLRQILPDKDLHLLVTIALDIGKGK